MDRRDIERYLQMLGQELTKQQRHGRVLLVGGAVMLLIIGNRNSTRDIDASMGSYHWDRYSAAESFRRIKQGEQPWVALGDFLDDWRRSDPEDRLELVTQPLEEVTTPDEQRWATLFAGAIEELCLVEGFPIPAWVMEARYYLQEPWYPTARKEALRRFMEETTPPAFKQRKVFIGDRALLRA